MFEDMVTGVLDISGNFSKKDVMALNPLVLAYIGDSIYEVFIRTEMVKCHPDYTVHKLHVESIGFVKAHAQAEILRKISSNLTEDELAIVKRGRNSKSGYVPKNADIIEYRVATGFEALLGYLYLTGDIDRLKYILELSIKEGADPK